MIGRYANLNVYEEIFKSADFYQVMAGALLIPVSFVISQNVLIFSKLVLVDVILIISIAINGVPIIIEALKGVFSRKINVDELVSIAIVACVLNRNFLEAAIVSAIMVVGALVEEAVSDSARNAIQKLIEVTPENAVVEKNGKEIKVSVSDIKIGEILVVRAGETISVDGTVIDGLTTVDESSITGESVPVKKEISADVYAGTTCVDGVIKVRATKIGQDSTIGKIIQMVKSAEQSKTESAKIVDNYATWFTPVILLVAIVTYLVTRDISRAITVLIVGCPCSFLLAGPVSTVAAIGRAAKAGILVKGGKYLENIATSTGFFFDKTGTITQGEPSVVKVITENNISETEILIMAAAIEQASLHPIARAIINKAEALDAEIPMAKEVLTEIGRGISGIVDGNHVELVTTDKYGEFGYTTVALKMNKKNRGYICLQDKPRDEAKQTVTNLRQTGIIDISILSGDQVAPVKKIADEVGIDNFYACLKPEEKLNMISRYTKGNLVYVGDGINDAPALKESDTGIAMGFRGSGVALETADIVLMNDKLKQLPFLITLSKKMSRIIKLNIGISFLINFVSIVAGAAGWLSPIMGAMSHNFGSILVVVLSASIGFAKE